MLVLLDQLIGQFGPLSHDDQLLARGILAGHGLLLHFGIAAGVLIGQHRLGHHPLHGRQRHRQGGAHGSSDLETRVGYHQKQRQGAVEGKLGSARGLLLEQ